MNNIQHACQECGATNSFPWKSFIDGSTGETFFKCTYCIVEDNLDDYRRLVLQVIDELPTETIEHPAVKARLESMKVQAKTKILAIKWDR